MNVAWITHRDYEGLGGAESSDRDMIAHRPDGVTVTLIKPGGVVEGVFEDFDHVVLSGMWGYSSRELNVIARAHPVFWVHDAQFSGHWVYEECRYVLCLTPQHRKYEMEKLPTLDKAKVLLNPGYVNPDEIKSQGNYMNRALWAHRPEGHKGLDLALEWCQEKGIELDVLVGRPREEVLEQMGIHKYFILLSHIFDPGPRAIMEAQLAGCEIVVNDQVGMYKSADKLLKRLETAHDDFWVTVLS